VGKLNLKAIDSGASVTALTYEALKQAIMQMNIYDSETDLRIDERRLAEELKVSRTPIREAIARLEHEGLLRTVPRRGTYVVRKTKHEIQDIVMAWAALESMAARLITSRASDDEVASLRRLFGTFDSDKGRLAAHIDEYSDANLAFHQRIIELSGSEVIRQMVDGLLVHMQAMRRRTIREDERFVRSIVDHMHIIEALEARDTELAERLVRDHALKLAQHVDAHVHYLGENDESTDTSEAV
jgi:DNA-binding GntR family transcriptional regulator